MPTRLSLTTFRKQFQPRQLQSRQHRPFSGTTSSYADFTHAVIGAGAVGLAIARKLQERDGASTVLIERHGSVGTETSSRNSEVIHAGLYYGHDSLKTNLCLQGKRMLYDLCAKHSIPHRNAGKWIVAQDEAQAAALEKVHVFARSIGVPTRFVPLEEGRRREPDVCARTAILESESTGILDSHAYMQFLHADFADRGGDTALSSPVTRIEALDRGRSGWRIYTDGATDPADAITAETLVNSAGLAACAVNNMVLPPPRHRIPYFAKGTYYAYSAARPAPRTLIYPAPVPGHAGLGTHLTLDMAGRVRFGPDVQWTDDPADLAPSAAGLPRALDDIQTYLPGLRREAVAPDYVGVRPKLARTHSAVSGDGFLDFYITREEGCDGFVNLLGIESPGLTASLAIAERVEGLLYR